MLNDIDYYLGCIEYQEIFLGFAWNPNQCRGGCLRSVSLSVWPWSAVACSSEKFIKMRRGGLKLCDP